MAEASDLGLQHAFRCRERIYSGMHTHLCDPRSLIYIARVVADQWVESHRNHPVHTYFPHADTNVQDNI